MLDIINIPAGGLIDIGVKIGDVDFWDPTFHAAIPGWIGLPWVNYSMVARELSFSYVPVQGVSPRLFYLGQHVVDPSPAHFHGFKPVKKPFDGLADFLNYSQPIAAVFDPSLLRHAPILNENGVSHPSLHGLLRQRVPYLWYNPVPYFHNEGSYPRYIMADNAALNGPRHSATDISGGVPVSYSVTYPFSNMNGTLSDVIKNLDALQEYDSDAAYIGLNSVYGAAEDVAAWCDRYGTHPSFCCADIVDEIGSSHIRFTNVVWRPGGFMRLTHVTLRYSLTPLNPPEGVNLDGHTLYRVRKEVSTDTSLLWEDAPAVGYLGLYHWHIIPSNAIAGVQHAKWEHIAESDAICFPLCDVYYPAGAAPESKLLTLITKVRRKEERLKDCFNLLRPSSMYSHTDAAGKLRTTDMNFVEAAAEADELFTLIPGLVEMVKLYQRGGYFSAAISLVDILANAKLWHDFGLRPTLQTLKEAEDISYKLGTDLNNFVSPQTVHGKFSYPIEIRGLGPMKLVTRTKARYRGIDDNFLLTMLRLDAYGILPRPGNMWGVVPFSWLVDYFANIQRRFNNFDVALLGMMRGADCFVHSYTLYDPLESTLEYLDLEGTFECKYYFREVSNFVPLRFDSEIDFGEPIRDPDAGILSALLWNLFRAN